MKKNSYRIGIIKNKRDIEISISNDTITNITGLMGSGKTTLSKTIHNNSNALLIQLDCLFCKNRQNNNNKQIK